MIERARITQVLSKLPELEQKLASGEYSQAVVREHARLKKFEADAAPYLQALDDLEVAKELELADEVAAAEQKIAESEQGLLAALLPPDPADARNAILEIRAGTGGDEAGLFAGDLFRMYSRWCEAKGWKLTIIDENAGELGGYKEVIASIAGDGAYGALRFESGTHRVQRVPATEQQGRLHTSAATVLVMPEAEPEDAIEIPAEELRIDIFCAGGHGGQGVNTTYSAVRLTHLPTGLVAQCQDERSQHRNKEKAMGVLMARLLDLRRNEETAKAGPSRRDLMGSGDRSQKIRTYNYPQNRVSDHRINLTLHALSAIMEGALDDLIDALHAHDREQRLANAAADALGAKS